MLNNSKIGLNVTSLINKKNKKNLILEFKDFIYLVSEYLYYKIIFRRFIPACLLFFS